jgi:nitrile hydratase subunit alpha
MSRNDPQGNRQGHRHADAHDRRGSALSEMDLRVRALESLLVEKGYVDPKVLDILIETCVALAACELLLH